MSRVFPLVPPPDDDLDELLNVEDVARILKVQPSWVYKHTELKKDGLPYVKVGRYKRFRESKVRQWIARHEKG